MIISNQAHCLVCDDKPYSAHRRDRVTCSCHNLTVDGGNAYIKRHIHEKDKVKELSIEIDDDKAQAIIKAVQDAINTNRNATGIAFAALRAVRDCRLLRGTNDRYKGMGRN